MSWSHLWCTAEAMEPLPNLLWKSTTQSPSLHLWYLLLWNIHVRKPTTRYGEWLRSVMNPPFHHFTIQRSCLLRSVVLNQLSMTYALILTLYLWSHTLILKNDLIVKSLDLIRWNLSSLMDKQNPQHSFPYHPHWATTTGTTIWSCHCWEVPLSWTPYTGDHWGDYPQSRMLSQCL